MITITDSANIGTYALCAIIVLHMLLYIPVIETYVCIIYNLFNSISMV